ncbi:MAG: SpoIVB peptidase S55 domain-containing protein, partial [Thermoanaerobaculia bacterium]
MNGTRVPVRTIVQKNRRVPATLFAMLFVFAAVAAHAETMPVSAVKKGMKGYGVTVFDGTTPEKFDVEILGVLNNIGPGQDLILAKIDSPVVRRTGVIAGMSGSPIYIDGKVIGALAYAWQFAKEPVAGITPIDEMLKIARNGGTTNALVAEAMPRFSGAELLNALA